MAAMAWLRPPPTLLYTPCTRRQAKQTTPAACRCPSVNREALPPARVPQTHSTTHRSESRSARPPAPHAVGRSLLLPSPRGCSSFQSSQARARAVAASPPARSSAASAAARAAAAAAAAASASRAARSSRPACRAARRVSAGAWKALGSVHQACTPKPADQHSVSLRAAAVAARHAAHASRCAPPPPAHRLEAKRTEPSQRAHSRGFDAVMCCAAGNHPDGSRVAARSAGNPANPGRAPPRPARLLRQRHARRRDARAEDGCRVRGAAAAAAGQSVRRRAQRRQQLRRRRRRWRGAPLRRQRRGVPQHRQLLRAQGIPGWHHILPLNPSSGTSLHAVRGHARRRRCALVWRQHCLLLQVQQV